MSRPSHSRLRRSGGALVVAVAVVLLAAVFAAPALAAPPGSTVSLSELQTLLDAGPVTGHFDTVLLGDTVESIPVNVLAIVPDMIPDGALILFEATGPAIDRIGGLAEGMSGSPLYVDDGGTLKLAGAVSQGDIFTTG